MHKQTYLGVVKKNLHSLPTLHISITRHFSSSRPDLWVHPALSQPKYTQGPADFNKQISELGDIIRSSQHLVAFTGSAISDGCD